MIVKVFPQILFGSTRGMTIFPFIFIKEEKLKTNVVFINHEKIHIRQQLEMLVIPFYVVYILEWLVRLFMAGNAYRNISFEREAYINQNNMNYLKDRKLFAWVKFLIIK